LVAVTNNYLWNRLWTFRAQRGGVAYQGMRFLLVSTMALLANLAVLQLLVTLGLGEVVAQAVAIVLVTPVNFVGNKLWSFGPRRGSWPVRRGSRPSSSSRPRSAPRSRPRRTSRD